MITYSARDFRGKTSNTKTMSKSNVAQGRRKKMQRARDKLGKKSARLCPCLYSETDETSQ